MKKIIRLFASRVIKKTLKTDFGFKFSTGLLRLAIALAVKTLLKFRGAEQRISKLGKFQNENEVEAFDRLVCYYRSCRKIEEGFPFKPKISNLLPLYKVKAEYFSEALQSIAIQTYTNWEICVVDDCSMQTDLHDILKRFSQVWGDKLKYRISESNQHISLNSNACLALATGEYVALLDNDDRIYPNALFEVVRFLNTHDRPDILFSDERNVDANGNPLNDVSFKPDFSPFMHFCMNYTTHFSVYNRQLLVDTGAFRKGFEGSQDHDVMLRMVEASKKPVVHIPLCLYQWRAHPQSTAASANAKPYAAIAGEKAVSEAFLRRGLKGTATYETDTCHYRLTFDLKGEPKVSVFIREDNAESLKHRIRTIAQQTRYKNFELVGYGRWSLDAECRLQTFALGSAEKPVRFANMGTENPSTFANKLASEVDGQVLIFVSGNIKTVNETWLTDLLHLVQLERIGAVSCKILQDDDRIKSAACMLSPETLVLEMGKGLSRRDVLYNNVLNTIHECTIVDETCFGIKKQTFETIGGFDTAFANHHAVLDLCLRLHSGGYSNLYTPYAEVKLENEPSFLKIDYNERRLLEKRWSSLILRDPYLNENLLHSPYYKVNEKRMCLEVTRLAFLYMLGEDPLQWNSRDYRIYLNKHHPI